MSSCSLKYWGCPSPWHTPVHWYQSESAITDNTPSFILSLMLLLPNSTMKNQHTPPEAIMHWSQSWEKVLCNTPHIPSKCLEVNMTGNLTVGNESSIHGTKCYKVGASAQTACVPRIPMVSFSVVQKYLLEDFFFFFFFLMTASKKFWDKKKTILRFLFLSLEVIPRDTHYTFSCFNTSVICYSKCRLSHRQW